MAVAIDTTVVDADAGAVLVGSDPMRPEPSADLTASGRGQREGARTATVSVVVQCNTVICRVSMNRRHRGPVS